MPLWGPEAEPAVQKLAEHVLTKKSQFETSEKSTNTGSRKDAKAENEP
jgi:hypothetical protein